MAVLAVVLAWAGCSDDDGGGSESKPEPPAQRQPPQQHPPAPPEPPPEPEPRSVEEMSEPQLEAACFEGDQAACDRLGH